jgi:hypothetical protein
MPVHVSALLLFMTNLFGLALGSSLVAAITDFVFVDAARVAVSGVVAGGVTVGGSAVGPGFEIRPGGTE